MVAEGGGDKLLLGKLSSVKLANDAVENNLVYFNYFNSYGTYKLHT